MRYAVVNSEGLVVNVTEADDNVKLGTPPEPPTQPEPPEGFDRLDLAERTKLVEAAALDHAVNYEEWRADVRNYWQPPEDHKAIVLRDGEDCSTGWTYDGKTFTAPPVVEVEPQPETQELLQSCLEFFGIVRGNQMLAAWPTFTRALDAGNWTIARQTVEAALFSKSITDDENKQLLILMEEHHIP